MKLNDFNCNNHFVLIINFCNHYDKALTKKVCNAGAQSQVQGNINLVAGPKQFFILVCWNLIPAPSKKCPLKGTLDCPNQRKTCQFRESLSKIFSKQFWYLSETISWQFGVKSENKSRCWTNLRSPSKTQPGPPTFSRPFIIRKPLFLHVIFIR